MIQDITLCPHLLAETGDALLLETGDNLALETGCWTESTGFNMPAAPIHGHFPIRTRYAWKYDYRNKS